MHNGLLIYHKDDYERNKEYIKWVSEEALLKGLNLEFVFSDKLHVSDKYNFAINRSRDSKVSKVLEENNILVFNSSIFTEIANDKLLSYEFVNSIKIPFSKLFYNSIDVNESTDKIIVKPRNGHGGEGIYVVDNNKKIEFKEEFIYQRVVENLIGDIRIYIINNEVINAVIRKPKCGELISNYSKGGVIELYTLNSKQKEIINLILNEIQIDYGGIDFILTENEFLFNEFEDAVGSRMLSKFGINNTTDMYLNHIRNVLDERERNEKQ